MVLGDVEAASGAPDAAVPDRHPEDRQVLRAVQGVEPVEVAPGCPNHLDLLGVEGRLSEQDVLPPCHTLVRTDLIVEHHLGRGLAQVHAGGEVVGFATQRPRSPWAMKSAGVRQR